MGEADMFEIISSRSLDRFVRRRFRRSDADMPGGMGQNTGKNERTVISPYPPPPEQEG
ncbi:hypothetical protein PbDSM24746_26000 [Paenibacillus macerans]|nr:hypothetical protein PbDSM24746_26000 [Paenibacillus macerans]GBK68908.1 hypothetical protein PbJCM17693_26160 [Paenibacillus macerans]GIP08491.1 hypothetical protein J1TS5_06610 [Paenibacillus macerans]